MNMAEFVIEKARKDRYELAIEYNISPSSVVWIGDNKYIVVTEKGEIKI